MKNLFLLLLVAMVATTSFGQIKVVSSGFTIIGDNTGVTPAAQLHVVGNVVLDSDEAVGSNFQRRNHVINGNNGRKNLQFSTNESTTNSFAYIQMFGDGTCSACGPLAARAGEFVLGGQYFQFRTGSTDAGFGSIGMSLSATNDLAVSGNVTANGILLTSDKRLKRDIEDFDLGLDAIMKMDVKKYFYTEDAGITSTRQHVGIMAQEFGKINPLGVVETAYVDVERGINEEYLAVDVNQITFMLVNALQDQQELIEAQGEKIAQMEEIINTIGSSETTNRSQVTLSSYDLAELNQNTPNPFNGTTSISYVVPTDASSAQISIFGTSGQLMKTLDIEHVGKGSLDVNAQDLPAGTYSYQLIVNGRSVESKKMVMAN